MNKSPCIIHLPRIQFSVKILKKNNNEIILELMKSTNRSIDRFSFLVIWIICCLVSTPKLQYNPSFNKLSCFRPQYLMGLFSHVLQVNYLFTNISCFTLRWVLGCTICTKVPVLHDQKIVQPSSKLMQMVLFDWLTYPS